MPKAPATALPGSTARWVAFVLLFAAHCQASPAEMNIRVFDARPLHRLNLSAPTNATMLWDTMHCISALQGLANRDEPRLYLLYSQGFGLDTDQFWLDSLRNEDGWLKNANISPIASVEEAIQAFPRVFRGLVVYDPLVPATANLASTAAGCEDLLPVRYDPSPGSLYDRLVHGMNLEVKLWLVETNGSSLFRGGGRIPGLDLPSTGSAKADACLWGLQRWVKSGKAAPQIAAYFIDSYWLKYPQRGPALHTLCNHDYFIANRAFFFDLSPWGDEPPNDDPGQPPGTDKRVFLQVMRAIYDRKPGEIIKVGGFIPWPHKYTSESSPAGKHEPVPTEWEFGLLISQFNGYMEADAAGLSDLSNASFFKHYPLKKAYPQKNSTRGRLDWQARGLVEKDGRLASKLFVGHYVGDYDAPAWLYKAVPRMFPNKSKTPLGWAFNPNLADRVPQALAYARANAGSNDWFIAGDSGAGYLNPRALTVRPESGLPSGLAAWTRHFEKYYKQWDLSITGFILDGSAGASTETEYRAYRKFSPDGAGTHFEPAPGIKGGIPTCRETDLPDSADKAAAMIARTARSMKGEPGFFWARSILKEPAWYDSVSKHLQESHPDAPVQIVDPYTFFELIRARFDSNRPGPGK